MEERRWAPWAAPVGRFPGPLGPPPCTWHAPFNRTFHTTRLLSKPLPHMRTLLFTLLIGLPPLLRAQSSGFGAGIILGEPTGISLKGWISSDRAIDGAIAWSLHENSNFSIHADYLFHNMDLIKPGKGQMALYYGPGLRLRTWSGHRYWRHGHWYDDDGGRAGLGIRFPVGLAYLPAKGPVDIFLEIVPGLDLVPSTEFDINGALGARYWF